MDKSQGELRVALLVDMEAEIDQLLNWEDETRDVTITDIEDQVLAARERISTRLTEALVQQRAAKADVTVPTDAESGQRLHYKGKKTKSARRVAGS